MSDPKNGSWMEYRQLVLQVLEDLEDRVTSLEGERTGDGVTAEGVRKDLSALKRVVFGGPGEESVEVRIDRLEEFRRNHPSVVEIEDGKKMKVDKKMLFLLIGAVGGLISVFAKVIDLISNILAKGN